MPVVARRRRIASPRRKAMRPRVPRPARVGAKTASPPPTRLGSNCRRRTMKESLLTEPREPVSPESLGSLAPWLELSTRINARHAKRLRDETNCEGVCVACVAPRRRRRQGLLCMMPQHPRGAMRGWAATPRGVPRLTLRQCGPSGHGKTCCGTTRDAIEPATHTNSWRPVTPSSRPWLCSARVAAVEEPIEYPN